MSIIKRIGVSVGFAILDLRARWKLGGFSDSGLNSQDRSAAVKLYKSLNNENFSFGFTRPIVPNNKNIKHVFTLAQSLLKAESTEPEVVQANRFDPIIEAIQLRLKLLTDDKAFYKNRLEAKGTFAQIRFFFWGNLYRSRYREATFQEQRLMKNLVALTRFANQRDEFELHTALVDGLSLHFADEMVISEVSDSLPLERSYGLTPKALFLAQIDPRLSKLDRAVKTITAPVLIPTQETPLQKRAGLTTVGTTKIINIESAKVIESRENESAEPIVRHDRTPKKRDVENIPIMFLTKAFSRGLNQSMIDFTNQCFASKYEEIIDQNQYRTGIRDIDYNFLHISTFAKNSMHRFLKGVEDGGYLDRHIGVAILLQHFIGLTYVDPKFPGAPKRTIDLVFIFLICFDLTGESVSYWLSHDGEALIRKAKAMPASAWILLDRFLRSGRISELDLEMNHFIDFCQTQVLVDTEFAEMVQQSFEPSSNDPEDRLNPSGFFALSNFLSTLPNDMALRKRTFQKFLSMVKVMQKRYWTSETMIQVLDQAHQAKYTFYSEQWMIFGNPFINNCLKIPDSLNGCEIDSEVFTRLKQSLATLNDKNRDMIQAAFARYVAKYIPMNRSLDYDSIMQAWLKMADKFIDEEGILTDKQSEKLVLISEVAARRLNTQTVDSVENLFDDLQAMPEQELTEELSGGGHAIEMASGDLLISIQFLKARIVSIRTVDDLENPEQYHKLYQELLEEWRKVPEADPRLSQIFRVFSMTDIDAYSNPALFFKSRILDLKKYFDHIDFDEKGLEKASAFEIEALAGLRAKLAVFRVREDLAQYQRNATKKEKSGTTHIDLLAGLENENSLLARRITKLESTLVLDEFDSSIQSDYLAVQEAVQHVRAAGELRLAQLQEQVRIYSNSEGKSKTAARNMILAIVLVAMKETSGKSIREIQLLTVLNAYHSNDFYVVGTGEGKTLVIEILCALFSALNEGPDWFNHTEALKVMQGMEYRKLVNGLDITLGMTGESKNPFESDTLAISPAEDGLLEREQVMAGTGERVKHQREPKVALMDEADATILGSVSQSNKIGIAPKPTPEQSRQESVTNLLFRAINIGVHGLASVRDSNTNSAEQDSQALKAFCIAIFTSQDMAVLDSPYGAYVEKIKTDFTKLDLDTKNILLQLLGQKMIVEASSYISKPFKAVIETTRTTTTETANKIWDYFAFNKKKIDAVISGNGKSATGLATETTPPKKVSPKISVLSDSIWANYIDAAVLASKKQNGVDYQLGKMADDSIRVNIISSGPSGEENTESIFDKNVHRFISLWEQEIDETQRRFYIPPEVRSLSEAVIPLHLRRYENLLLFSGTPGTAEQRKLISDMVPREEPIEFVAIPRHHDVRLVRHEPRVFEDKKALAQNLVKFLVLQIGTKSDSSAPQREASKTWGQARSTLVVFQNPKTLAAYQASIVRFSEENPDFELPIKTLIGKKQKNDFTKFLKDASQPGSICFTDEFGARGADYDLIDDVVVVLDDPEHVPDQRFIDQALFRAGRQGQFGQGHVYLTKDVIQSVVLEVTADSVIRDKPKNKPVRERLKQKTNAAAEHIVATVKSDMLQKEVLRLFEEEALALVGGSFDDKTLLKWASFYEPFSEALSTQINQPGFSEWLFGQRVVLQLNILGEDHGQFKQAEVFTQNIAAILKRGGFTASASLNM